MMGVNRADDTHLRRRIHPPSHILQPRIAAERLDLGDVGSAGARDGEEAMGLSVKKRRLDDVT